MRLKQYSPQWQMKPSTERYDLGRMERILTNTKQANLNTNEQLIRDTQKKHVVWNGFISYYFRLFPYIFGAAQNVCCFSVMHVRFARQRDEGFLSQNYLP